METNKDKTEDGKLNSAHSFTEGNEIPESFFKRGEEFIDRAYQLGIDDFKSALRKEIETWEEEIKLERPIGERAYLFACSRFKEKLDSVTPPKQ